MRGMLCKNSSESYQYEINHLMKLLNITKKLIGKTLRYIECYKKLGVFHIATMSRIRMLEMALSYVRDEKVKGDYFEFGVARGLTFIAAYHLNRKLKADISKFYDFDSFEGFPEPEGIDKEFERFKKGEEAWSLKEFKKNLRSKNVSLEKVAIYKGWFKDTLSKDLQEALNNKTKISIAWIDCDMYTSTKQVLNFIPSLLTQGSILIFDDYFCYRGDPNKGEQRAMDEFLKRNSSIELIPYQKFGIVGNSFIVNIKK